MIKKLVNYTFTRKKKMCYYLNMIGEVDVMKRIDIYDVANFFLKIVDRDAGSTITPLKLQKILYYSQGYYLAKYGKPLFKEDFQAWAHGPVNPGVYEKYKDYHYSSIDYPNEIVVEFDSETANFLSSIWNVFGIFDGKYLESLTHNETPWIEARKGYEPGEKCEVVITKKAMQKFFSTNPYEF